MSIGCRIFCRIRESVISFLNNFALDKMQFIDLYDENKLPGV